MDIAIFKTALEASATAALALFAMLMLRKSYEDRLADKDERIKQEQERREQERADKLQITALLQDVNRTLGQNTTVLQEVCTVLDVVKDCWPQEAQAIRKK
ncbi:MAG: hypothetical protein FJW34_21470 [Acidobacteria bacterium]|nr:hypothetical protein [Acidobacteriota bacterium]